MNRLSPVIALIGILAGIATAGAQTYPSHPVTMIVPFAAGGPMDTVARVVSDGMRASLGQPVIIENVVGAGGSIATAAGQRTSSTAPPILFPMTCSTISNPLR
jgi:tripartite-type tricarboxylate transporter receptor subunit TctC